MKKTLLISACVALSVAAIAQQKKTTTHTVAKAGMSADKMKMLCKPWKLDTTETYGVYAPANAKQQNDGVTFMSDSTLFYTKDGAVKTGKWYAGWGQTINFVLGDNKEKMMLTIKKLSDGYLELEYQTPDLTREHYFYSAKK